jgi:hypothetical protein
MNNNVIEVRNVVDEYIHRIATLLRQILSERQVFAVIHPGTWANEAGIVTGYLSCFPHDDPAEDTIDAEISFTVVNGEARYSVDISWSDGTVIEDIVEGKITYTALSELLGKITEICMLAENELGIRLANLIVKLKNESPGQ